MLDAVQVLCVVYWTAALVMVLPAVLLACGKVKPDGRYGVRVPITVRGRDAWGEASSVAGIDLIGVAIGLGFLGLALFRGLLSVGPAIALGGLWLLLGSVGAGVHGALVIRRALARRG